MPQRSPWKPDRPLFIGLAGGSGSGKTTIAESVLDHLDGKVALVQHDAYYRHAPELSYRGAHQGQLRPPGLTGDRATGRASGGPAVGGADRAPGLRLRGSPPVRRHGRGWSRHRWWWSRGSWSSLEPELRSELDLKIFVDTDPDVRLARRLQRDIEERGRTVDSVVSQYFDTVRPMHIEYVETSKRYADLIIPEGYNPRAVATVVELIRSRLG